MAGSLARKSAQADALAPGALSPAGRPGAALGVGDGELARVAAGGRFAASKRSVRIRRATHAADFTQRKLRALGSIRGRRRRARERAFARNTSDPPTRLRWL